MKLGLRRALNPGRLLNMSHPLWLRWPMGGIAAIFALVTTREPALAREVARRIIQQDDLQRAARRISFYARRSWLRLNLSKDMVYVFCNQMSEIELAALRRFLLRRQKAHMPGLVSCDLAYVSAAQAISIAADPDRKSDCALALDQFRQDADHVLQVIDYSPADLADLPVEKSRADFALDSAAEALVDFAAEMQGISQSWFVLSGTLLGIVREGGFLKHDYDIDVGVMANDVDASALRDKLNATHAFRCGELELQTSFEPGGYVARRPVFMKVSHRNGIYIDIFVHYIEPNADGDPIVWHASSLFRWDNSDFILAPYTLAGVDVMGPDDADRYLTENYGNWRVPVTEFNSALDTTNQSVVRNPLSVAIFLRRIWMAERSNPQGAAALRRALIKGGFILTDGQTRMNPRAFD